MINKNNIISAHQSSSNFNFLEEHDPIFLQLAQSAERYFVSDPNTCLFKVRQLGEALAQDLASRCGIEFDQNVPQSELIGTLFRQKMIDKDIKDALHILRDEGNKAIHQFQTNHFQAHKGIKTARDICIWYHQNFGKNGRSFKAPPFAKLEDPSEDLQKLQQQIHTLQQQIQSNKANQADAEKFKELALLQEQEKQEYWELAESLDKEAKTLAEQNKLQEQQLQALQASFDEHIKALQTELEEAKQTNNQKPVRRISLSQFLPSEEVTRILIDEQLRQAGWEVDSSLMTYAKGERPEKGKNKAIAEWQIGKDRADYVLFVGLMPIAVVEAKKQNKDVSGKITQAERYASKFKLDDSMLPAWQYQQQEPSHTPISPWQNSQQQFFVPFVFSTNGRPYFEQHKEQSGIWFRDVRKASNIKRALQQFHSPQGLLDLLTRDIAQAEVKLNQEPLAYLNLRDYQQTAIQQVEHSLSQGQKNILVAMATGTGKTRTIIGLIYRLLKAERFKRILFLVDRTSLGTQALDSMKEMPLEQNLTLSSIYNINELGDMQAEAETRAQVATVQAMVQRIFNSDEPLPIDAFDCIIVDEAHRGYTLDQEMTEGEIYSRDASLYLSSYRRVLDYFDAVRIGLTATPAKHTVDIFGYPVYIYSYREAVADDWLIDYEPPIRYETQLSKNGIKFDQGETVQVINTLTGNIDTVNLEDELNFDVASFNRTVITEGFNRVICQELAKQIDPNGDEKTLIFCATDKHADMVKSLLDEAFVEVHGEDYHEESARKITGQSDKPDGLIRQFKNERFPSIAITVDLLTTGIDVPAICHLVFLRRVKSRILYEQMKGRATRRCDDIGKTFFKIHDPVDLYGTLQAVDTMPPLVKNPNISLEQLIDELLTLPAQPLDHQAIGSQAEPTHADTPNEKQDENKVAEPSADYILTPNQSANDDDINYDIEDSYAYQQQVKQTHAKQVLDEISQKLMRILRKASKKAEKKPEIKAKLEELQTSWEIKPSKLHETLHSKGVAYAQDFLRKHSHLIKQLYELKILVGTDNMPIIYTGEDKIIGVEQTTDEGTTTQTTDDYLESFDRFIKEQVNQSTALSVVANKPKDLTRDTLKQIKMLLDENGYSEAKLQAAWRNKTNQDIAASIVGHIRRAAIGEALIPFELRVSQAMNKIFDSHAWTPIQRNWLNKIAKQLKHEGLIDRDFVRQRFAKDGGDKKLDKLLDNQLDTVIKEINEYLWMA